MRVSEYFHFGDVYLLCRIMFWGAMYLFDQNHAAVMLISVRVFLNGKTGLPFTCEWQEVMVDEWLFCLKEHYTPFCLIFFFPPCISPQSILQSLGKSKMLKCRGGGLFSPGEVKSNTKTTWCDKADNTWASLIGAGRFCPLSGSAAGEAGNIFTLSHEGQFMSSRGRRCICMKLTEKKVVPFTWNPKLRKQNNTLLLKWTRNGTLLFYFLSIIIYYYYYSKKKSFCISNTTRESVHSLEQQQWVH